jgi:hypothetical protein
MGAPAGRHRGAGVPAALPWALWALAVLGLATAAWCDQLLRQAGRPDLVQFGAGGAALALGTLSAATAGAVLAGRRPRHPVGWLLLTFALVPQALTSAAEGYARYALLARPEPLPAASHVGALASTTFVPGLGCIGFILLLTPTGSLPSPRWRWWAWVAAALPLAFLVSWVLGAPVLDPDSPSGLGSVANPFAIPALAAPLQAVYGTTSPATALTMIVAAGSLVLRFRRARGTERQQLRWLALAAALAPLAVLVTAAGILTEQPSVANVAAGLYLALLPLAIGASIARYRLYDLDRIVSRTLAYGLLTLLLGLGYAAAVLLLGGLFGGLGRQPPSWAVAAATLAVAALFQPARRRVQAAVDRRFDRRRYDAARTIQTFSARLRQQVDLDTLTAELLAVVDQTMQPTRVSLWLRPTPPARSAP